MTHEEMIALCRQEAWWFRTNAPTLGWGPIAEQDQDVMRRKADGFDAIADELERLSHLVVEEIQESRDELDDFVRAWDELEEWARNRSEEWNRDGRGEHGQASEIAYEMVVDKLDALDPRKKEATS